MNLIYLHTHDTGRYLQPYGYPVDTPDLQAFAKEATLFRNNFCCGPTCSPSRSSMLTGLYPHNCGMMGLAHRGFNIFDMRKHLAQFLGRQGYETMLCGMQHEAADASSLGYERTFIANKSDCRNATEWDMANADAAIAFLEERHDKPFFLSYGLEHTHRPFLDLDMDISPDNVVVPGHLPDVPEVRRDFSGFLTSARYADRCLGRVLDTLDRLNLFENSVVLYTTDHGIAFPWMKCSLYDDGIGTAMMLHYPDNPSRGRVIDALTSHLDVFPTLCDLLGLEKPDWLQGVSLTPLLNRHCDDVRDAVFAQVIYHVSYEPQLAVRTRRYKYIKRFSSEYPYPAPANVDQSITKEYLIAQGFADARLDDEQLYDLALDPAERNNLVEKGQILSEMRNLLKQWMQDTDHPLLHGPVPLPKGGFAIKHTCSDPESEDPNDRIYAI